MPYCTQWVLLPGKPTQPYSLPIGFLISGSSFHYTLSIFSLTTKHSSSPTFAFGSKPLSMELLDSSFSTAASPSGVTSYPASYSYSDMTLLFLGFSTFIPEDEMS